VRGVDHSPPLPLRTCLELQPHTPPHTTPPPVVQATHGLGHCSWDSLPTLPHRLPKTASLLCIKAFPCTCNWVRLYAPYPQRPFITSPFLPRLTGLTPSSPAPVIHAQAHPQWGPRHYSVHTLLYIPIIHSFCLTFWFTVPWQAPSYAGILYSALRFLRSNSGFAPLFTPPTATVPILTPRANGGVALFAFARLTNGVSPSYSHTTRRGLYFLSALRLSRTTAYRGYSYA